MNRRELVRKLAAESWVESGGDVDGAMDIFRRKVREPQYGFSIVVIAAIVQIAYYLFLFWKSMRVSDPLNEAPLEGEPEIELAE